MSSCRPRFVEFNKPLLAVASQAPMAIESSVVPKAQEDTDNPNNGEIHARDTKSSMTHLYVQGDTRRQRMTPHAAIF